MTIRSNSFEVERPVEETYQILTDLEFIAPCFPGAQLTEIEGEVLLPATAAAPVNRGALGQACWAQAPNVARAS